jgi:predicted chitinase
LSYLPDTYNLSIPSGLIREIIAELNFCDDLEYIPENGNPFQDHIQFRYCEQIIGLDYNWQYSQIMVSRKMLSANHMVNPAKLITDRVEELQKLQNFIEETVHNEFMKLNGHEVLGVAFKDNEIYLVYNTVGIDQVYQKNQQATLTQITDKKHKRQLRAMLELTAATTMDVEEGWKWRSRSLSKITIGNVKYQWLSYERLIAETCDPNYMRHTVQCIWYLKTLSFDELMNFVIIDLQDLLTKLINYRS